MGFNTNNPLGSSDERDFYDNSANLDKALNSEAENWTDRLGVERPTVDYVLKQAGFTPAGFDFKTGGTLRAIDRNKCVFNQADQTWYMWQGDLPKTVAANSTPNPLGDNGWKPAVINTGALDGASFIGQATYSQIRNYRGSGTTINCSGENNIFDGKYGTFKYNPQSTSSDDNGITTLVDVLGRRWERVFKGILSPRYAGIVGDGVTDDTIGCQALITAFKQRGRVAPGGIDMLGDSIDWSGFKCKISGTIDLSGMFNYTFINPTFIALSNFTGSCLLKIDSDHTYLASMITWLNPQLDAAWSVDYCVEAYDFLKWVVIGGKFSHYKKKGFITGKVRDAAHEINMLGTFFFQREYNETFPPSITEGEAWELNNYDNEFTNIVIGYQKQYAFTNNKGANRFIGGHIYTGHDVSTTGGARSLDSDDDFVGTYFDYTWLQIANTRTSVSLCKFAINNGNIAIKIGTSPFQVKIVGNRFRKTGSGTAKCIEMPTVAAGRTARPIIYDNTFEGCTGINTVGNLFNAISTPVVTIPVPDDFLPLSVVGQISKPTNAIGAFSDRIFGTEYDPATNILTIKCWKIESGGTLTPASLDGKSCIIPLNFS